MSKLFLKERKKLQKSHILFKIIFMFFVIILILPLLLKCPTIKSIVLLMLSFTNDVNYKIAYIELISSMVGSFVAVYGALWVQRKVDGSHERSEQKRYARIVYYDLYFAFRDFQKIYDNIKATDVSDSTTIGDFSENLLKIKLYINPNWIVDVAQLGDVLSNEDLTSIYSYYGKLSELDRAIQSGELAEVISLYERCVAWFMCSNNGQVAINQKANYILAELKKIFF